MVYLCLLNSPISYSVVMCYLRLRDGLQMKNNEFTTITKWPFLEILIVSEICIKRHTLLVTRFVFAKTTKCTLFQT